MSFDLEINSKSIIIILTKILKALYSLINFFLLGLFTLFLIHLTNKN